jgi:sugar/nucleoside kinase (ribokinase family)
MATDDTASTPADASIPAVASTPSGRAEPSGGPPRVVVIGSAARDHAPDDPRGWRLGGGVSFSALTSATLGVPTGALIGVDEQASSAEELDLLRAAGVDVRLVPLEHGPVFDNIETPGGRIQLCFDRSDPVPVGALPPEWSAVGAWIFGPVAAEIPEEWADAVPSDALVAVGWQGLLRDLVPGERVRHRRPGPSRIIARADFIGVSRDDFDEDVSLEDLCRLMQPGATLAITQGARGGLVLVADPEGPRALRRWPPIPPAEFVDATGAGDVFLAALLTAYAEPRLIGGRFAQGYDLLLAAAASSCVIERPGLLGVPDRETVRRRILEAPRHPHAVADPHQ